MMQLRWRADTSSRTACGFPEGEALQAKFSWRRASNKRKKKWLFEEKPRENFWLFFCYFLRLGIYSKVLAKLGEKTQKQILQKC